MGAAEEEGLLTHLEGQTGGREGAVVSLEPTALPAQPPGTDKVSTMEVPPLFRICPFLIIMCILAQRMTSHSEATVYLLQG